jgi:hypothetical protein
MEENSTQSQKMQAHDQRRFKHTIKEDSKKVQARNQGNPSHKSLAWACSALTMSPVMIISSAVAAPTSLGSRWVPPAPGSSPLPSEDTMPDPPDPQKGHSAQWSDELTIWLYTYHIARLRML